AGLHGRPGQHDPRDLALHQRRDRHRHGEERLAGARGPDREDHIVLADRVNVPLLARRLRRDPLLPGRDRDRVVEDRLEVRLLVVRQHPQRRAHLHRAYWGAGADELGELDELVRSGAPVRTMEVRAALRMLSDNEEADLKAVFNDAIAVPSRKKWVTPKTPGQKRYVDAIRKHDMVFAIGPAGTGKSFLAVAMAVSALMKREAARIVLTRPAVEAGERLGFLPGDLYEKVHPYLRPLYDALYDMLEAEKVQSLMEKGAIEIAP